ncbi:MAG: glycoside hydrolase family 44 protein, partial [Terracidiphilus sp.]
SYNGSIPAGGSLTGMGFNGTWNNATNAIPTSFMLNGVTCGAPVGSFKLAPSAATLAVTDGSSATDTITVTDVSPFSGSATLAATGLPSGVSATFGTNPATGSSVVTFTASATATAGTSNVTITGTSAGLTASTTIALTVNLAPTFTISLASPLSITQGGSTTDTIIITDIGGFTGNVSLAISGLPSGVTCTIGTNPASTTSVLTCTASATAVVGTFPATIIGTSGTTTSSTTIMGTVVSSTGSFTIASSPTNCTMPQGGSCSVTISITDISPFSGQVTLSASGLPTGISVTSISVNPATTTSVITFAASATASIGTSSVTITGTSGTLTNSIPITLTVTAAPSFTIAPAAASLSVASGSSGTDTIAVTDLNGFAGSVTLALAGLPSGVTAALGTNPTTGTSVVTFTASSTAIAGTSMVTITGVSGTLTASTTISLTVTGPVGAGMACNVVYTITPQSSTAFGAAITIDNTGTTAWTSWTLQWTFANGQTIQSLWNGIETQSGALVTVTNESYNASVPAGGSVTGIGFNGNLVGGNAVPTAFSVNGTLCGALSGAPPLAPTGLTATSGNQQIALAWTASLTATSYNVLRSTTSGGPYTTVGTSATTSFTNTGLTNGTIYYYVVAAVNTAGTGADSTQVFAEPGAVPANVTISVNPTQTQPISPWIYGIDAISNASIPNVPDVTIYRMGGNRWTAYNWTTNASNAGSDFEYESDDFLTASTVPGFAVYPSINANIAAGQATLFTVPMQGLVSADESGPVPTANAPDLARFQTIVDQKSSVSSAPFTTTPPIVVVSGEDTGNVYSDEFVWAMNQLSTTKSLFSGTTSTPAFVDLDNEPDLWNSTHLEIQGPTEITPAAYIAKTLTMTEALKTQFPNMLIFGPSHYGFLGVYNFQNGVTGTTPTGENWFTDEYFQALSTASATFGKPLVDVYDFHWYPEDYDASSTRVTSLTAATLADADMQLIVQAPRNLWDPTFTDPGNSDPWVNSVLGGAPIEFLPRLQSKINAEFPSIKLSISEYETGGFNNIAGTVAQADELGVFASQGVFAGMMWPPSGTYDYELAGFRAYRNFDGAGSNFGNQLVQTTSSNPGAVTVYVSNDTTTPGRVVMIAVNRANTTQVAAISGLSLSGTANMYQMTATTATAQSTAGSPVTPVSIGSMAVSGSSLTLTLPAYSVTTLDVQ